MNSKERIEAIFAGKTPDRIGRYEQSIFSSVASEILGRRAYSAGTGLHKDEAEAWLAGDAAHEDFVEQLITDRAELGEILGFDMMGLPWRFAARPSKKVSDNEYLYGDENGEWDIYKYDEASETFGKTQSSRGRETIEHIKRQVRRMEADAGKEPDGEPAYVEFLKRLLARYGDTMAVLGAGGISIPLEEEWLMATATDPGVVGAFLDMFAEGNIREMRRQAALGVKIIWAGGDFADNAGPVYGPKVFRELLLPRLKRVLDECHRLGMWYLFRSDGNLWSVTDMMFNEAGVDGYGEIDWAAGMDLAELKKRYPKVAYWGNLPPAVVRDGTREEVLAACRHCIDAVKDDKRLILGASNAVLPGTPVENVYAMSEAVRMWG